MFDFLRLIWEAMCSFFACFAFGIVFQLHGGHLPRSAIGGAIAWFSYRLFGLFLTNDIMCYFLATIALSIFSEVMARRFRAPASIYLVIALLPLVPGGGIYETMEHCIQGNTLLAMTTGLHTVGIAGALAVGIVMVSSTVRMLNHRSH